jgi:hypothetical protein
MKKIAIVLAALVGVGLLFSIISAVYVIGTLNREADLHVVIDNKQKDNENEFDNMWKKIAKTAQVPDAYKNSLKDIIIGNAQARALGNGGNNGALATWIQEAVPNVDKLGDTYVNLMNIITSSQDAFTFRQKELLGLNTTHNQMFKHVVEGALLRGFGRKETEVVIITSTKTEKVFKAGKDDDVSVFPTTQPVEKK